MSEHLDIAFAAAASGVVSASLMVPLNRNLWAAAIKDAPITPEALLHVLSSARQFLAAGILPTPEAKFEFAAVLEFFGRNTAKALEVNGEVARTIDQEVSTLQIAAIHFAIAAVNAHFGEAAEGN